jgi:hypothetical protein
VVVFSLGLLIVPWATPDPIHVRGRNVDTKPTDFDKRPWFTYSGPDPPVYASSGYCLIFALPEGASIAFGRMWPPLAVVVMGTALGMYLAYGQDRRTPFYGKPPPV